MDSILCGEDNERKFEAVERERKKNFRNNEKTSIWQTEIGPFGREEIFIKVDPQEN